ncbi:aldo/keto reductase [Micropruina sp.]|uniref:aldo/keto reductase n=1 Tax=Micropruina sp. TaxID=2737536 RepID=UPI0039E43C7A
MVLTEHYTLSNGIEIPKLGLGTWMIADDKAADAVRAAVAIGYRHIDTAQGYDNERGVGDGVRTSGVPREELFVTTKLQADFKTYDEARAAIEGSLAALDIGYIDLMIIHSPWPWAEFRGEDRHFAGNLEAWRALEEFHQTGKIRSIGVSNFEQPDIENVLQGGAVKPVVNQILAHVTNTPFDVIDYCHNEGILVEAYSPVGHGELLGNPDILTIAEKYQVSVPQLCIRYTLQLSLLPLPKAANPDHMRQNAELDFEISDEDMDTLKNLAPIKDYGQHSEFPVFWRN